MVTYIMIILCTVGHFMKYYVKRIIKFLIIDYEHNDVYYEIHFNERIKNMVFFFNWSS